MSSILHKPRKMKILLVDKLVVDNILVHVELRGIHWRLEVGNLTNRPMKSLRKGTEAHGSKLANLLLKSSDGSKAATCSLRSASSFFKSSFSLTREEHRFSEVASWSLRTLVRFSEALSYSWWCLRSCSRATCSSWKRCSNPSSLVLTHSSSVSSAFTWPRLCSSSKFNSLLSCSLARVTSSSWASKERILSWLPVILLKYSMVAISWPHIAIPEATAPSKPTAFGNSAS